jgi:hypothetical protein
MLAHIDTASLEWSELAGLTSSECQGRPGVHACPYCSYPSVLASCCVLRKSNPVSWGREEAIQMLRMLSKPQHCLSVDFGCLDDLDSEENLFSDPLRVSIYKIFRREKVMIYKSLFYCFKVNLHVAFSHYLSDMFIWKG